MLNKKSFLMLIIFIVLSLSCQVTTTIISTPTLDLSPYRTQTAQSKKQSQEYSTATANQLLVAQGTLSAIKTETALSTQENLLSQTSVKITQAQLETQTAGTQAAINLLTATKNQVSIQTVQAESFYKTIKNLAEKGVISSVSGYYREIDDFDQNWPQLGWYRYWSTGFSPENFVIASDIEWESASMSADFTRSGCGFVFGEIDEENYSLAYLALDGFVHLVHVYNGDWRWLVSRRYGRLSLPEGNAEIMMVVVNQRITFFVNGEEVAAGYDRSYAAGTLNYTLLSGTNKDFGTSCNMKNTELWVIE